ncbi:MFS transporter [Microcella sp.]|uniref:MFS transporter n=1 Tax=Microcella sp. TaxID=1913979 RepID=UPI00345B8B00
MPPPFRWRSIVAPALLPTLLFTIGEGAIIPLIPSLAAQVGADLATAGLVAAMLLVGQLMGDLPAGWIVARVGERAAMLGALATSGFGIAISALAPTAALLGVGMLVLGASAAVFALARHALLTTAVPAAYRARALSTLGGVYRLGLMIGPFLGAAIITLTGETGAVYWLAIGALVGVAASLLLLPDPEQLLRREIVSDRAPVAPLDVLRTIGRRRDVLARLGLAALTVSALRASRQVLLPLWAVSIGLGDAQTATIIGATAAVDFALFYLGGWLMDRFGRLYTAVPSTVGLGLGFIVLAVTAGIDNPIAWFIGVAIWLALANGIGAGILMTMGSDLAGRTDPAMFLGAWRLILDAGGAAAPLVLAALTAAFSLAVGAGVLGVLGLVGAGMLGYMIPRHLPRDTEVP